MQIARIFYKDREIEDYGKTQHGRVIYIPGHGLVCIKKADWLRVQNGEGQHTKAEVEEVEKEG